MFRRNVGGIDRVLRVTLGIVLFLAGLLLLAGRSSLGMIVAVVGLLALVTGLVRVCALYIPFGISTAQPEGRVGRKRPRGPSMNEIQRSCGASKPSALSETEDGAVATSTGQSR